MDQGLKKGENLWDLGLLGKEFLDDAKSMIHKREETDKLDLIKIKSFYSVRSGSVSQSVMSDFLETPWTVALQAPLSMELSRQDYWSGLPFSPPGDLPNPGTEPKSPALQIDSLRSEPPGDPFYSVKDFVKKDEKTSYGLGETFYKPHISQRSSIQNT